MYTKAQSCGRISPDKNKEKDEEEKKEDIYMYIHLRIHIRSSSSSTSGRGPIKSQYFMYNRHTHWPKFTISLIFSPSYFHLYIFNYITTLWFHPGKLIHPISPNHHSRLYTISNSCFYFNLYIRRSDDELLMWKRYIYYAFNVSRYYNSLRNFAYETKMHIMNLS